MFGGLIASGWHIASKMMRLFVDNYVDHRTALGSPGLDELRWLKPVRPGDTLTGWVDRRPRCRPKAGRRWASSTSNGGHQPEGRAGDDDQGHQHGAAEAAMKRAVKGLDHVVVMVDGIDAAEAQYEKLGFQVQPRGFHTKLGTANHLMIFDTRLFRDPGHRRGHAVQCRAPRMAEGRRRPRQRGAGDRRRRPGVRRLQGGRPQPRRAAVLRPAVEVAGKTEHAQFRTVRIPKTNMPVVGFFVCEHLTPQFVYRDEWASIPTARAASSASR